MHMVDFASFNSKTHHSLRKFSSALCGDLAFELRKRQKHVHPHFPSKALISLS